MTSNIAVKGGLPTLIGFGTVGLLVALFPWLVTNALSSTYLPHGFCFQWNARLLWQHVVSDVVIWASYVFIALTLVRLVVTCRREIPFQSIFLAFGSFIVACAFTHFMGIVVLWKPLYWLEGDVKVITALASLMTAVALPFYLPRVKHTLRQAIAAADNERKFLAATDSSLDSFYILESIRDAEGTIVDFRFTFANSVGLKLISHERDEVIGSPLCELIPENRVAGFFDLYKRVVETGEPVVDEFSLNFKDVRTDWLKMQVIKLDDGIAITTSDITGRKQREHLARESERRFLAAAESSLDSLFLLDSLRNSAGEIIDFRFNFVNKNAARLVGRQPAEMIGQRLCELMPQNRSWGFFDIYRRVVETGQPHVQESAVSGFEGVECEWLKLQVVRLDDGVAVTASDISDRKRMEAERSRAFTESLIYSSPAAIIITDLDYIIQAINPAAERMLWYKPEELIGRTTPLTFFAGPEVKDRAAKLSAEFGKEVTFDEAIFFVGRVRGVEHEAEWNFLRKGGSRLAVQVTVTPLNNGASVSHGFMITAYDVSERKRREEYISHISQHDALTGLPTRQLLFDRLQMMLARSQRYRSESALLMIDLDHFKRVNDSLGHHAGDELLLQVASRLSSALRATDTVARMGGDEFIVLLSDLNGEQDAQLVAEKLLYALLHPFTLHEQTVTTIGASIGICMYPACADDAQSMLRNADVAMYHAKSGGGSHVQFFSKDIAHLAHHREEIERGLRESLRTGDFELHYQPEVDLATGETVGLEALLRWRSARLGNVPPSEFIPVAEEAGLIQPIGAWVLNKACEDIQRLNRQLQKSLFVSVNLSPYQLEQSDLLTVVDQALSANTMDAGSLEVEITEGVLMKDSPESTRTLDGLRKLGVRIAIDDFGTGFSSMSYLLRFSVDRLKIDRSFVRSCSTESNSSTVTSAIIALAHQLKISVIAEGVETRDQVEFLKAAGCDLVQGFYYSKPVSLQAIVLQEAATDEATQTST